jgi:hypothetical protein
MAKWTYETTDVVVSTLFEFISYPVSCNEIIRRKSEILDLIKQKGGYGERNLKAVEPLIKNILSYITNHQYNFSLGTKLLHDVVDKYEFSYDVNTKLISTKK